VLVLLLLVPAAWASSSQSDRTTSLLKELKDKDWEVRRRATFALRELASGNKKVIRALIGVLRDEDSRIRRSGAEALGKIGPKAKAAVPKLLVLLQDEDSAVRQSAAVALGRIGPKATAAVRTLKMMLEDEDPRSRRSAAEALGRIGPKAKATILSLTRALEDKDSAVRQSAAEALGKIGSKKGIAALIKMMKDEDATVRQSAAEALARIGKPTIPSLVRALRNENPVFLHSVVSALGMGGTPAASALIAVLKNPQENLLARQYAAMALAKIGAEVKKVVPALIESLKDDDSRIRRSVAGALGKIGPEATAALPELIEILKDQGENSLVRQYAATALARIGPRADEVDSALVEALSDDDSKIHEAAIKALAEIGPRTEPTQEVEQAVPALIRKLTDGDTDTRQPVLGELGKIGRWAVPGLISILKNDEPVVRQYAAMALARIGPEAENAVPTLIEVLEERNNDTEVRRLVATALGMIGPNAKAGISVLTNRLQDREEDGEVRGAAAQALGMIGPEAKVAVPALIESLKDNDSRIRGFALAALERIGPPPKAHIPTLLAALKDDDLEVRGDASLSIQNFVKARLEQWRPLLSQSDTPVLRSWVARHDELYATGDLDLETLAPNRNGEGRTTDILNVLGGRPAVRETLQLQLIDAPGMSHNGLRDIPISDVLGLQVKSHPFEEMLKETQAEEKTLPLADLVPSDHFFAHFATLPALMDFLEGGSDFLFRLGSAFAVNSIGYDLKSRYLAHLGLSEEHLRQWQATGVVQEIGIVLPDLFLIDGTEVTALVRVSARKPVQATLPHVDVEGLAEPNIVERKLESGRKAYWALRDDIFFFSTSRSELDKVLKLRQKAGRDSLGRSAEFRYMLQQLPIREETRAYFYFSDPFLRHLVGPGTKIAQLRRMQTRADLEMLTAGALLYRLDGQRGIPALGKLVKLGYVPREFASRNYTVHQNFVSESEKYGPLPDLKSLVENPVQMLSQEEAAAYESYVGDYSRFWRQFFDPIAMRLDNAGDETLELTTLILPLLDSDIYDEITKLVSKEETGAPLKVPKLRPEPAFLLSANLSDSLRIKLTEKLTGALVQYTSVSPAIFDSFGSAIHFAIQDSKPIVALGSGDILGAFSEGTFADEGLSSVVPALLSVLTRPCKLVVELKDPSRVLNFLRQAGVKRSLGGGQGELYQVEGRDAWIYKLTLFEMIQLHLGVAIENGYLVISNLPWAQHTTVEDVVQVPLNGARLHLNLGAVSDQLPALHTKAFSDYRAAAIDGMGYLYPLLTSGVAITVEEAQEKHLALFGFKPVHPGPGTWLWQDGELKSSVLGSPVRPMQPAFRSGDRAFGLFQKIDSLSVNMQLEDTGLRARVRWKLADTD
jgi:HEAT repeat protein